MTMVAALLGLLQMPGGSIEGVLYAAEVRAGDAVVYLVPLDSTAAQPASERQTIDQRNLRFIPRVLTTSPGSMVEFLNSDALLHNVFSPPGIGAAFDLGVYSMAERRARVFDSAGAYVILCHIHPEMLAYVVVAPSRYRAVSDREGNFRLDNVPPGRYELRVWHRRLAATPQEIVIPPESRLQLRLLLHPRSRTASARDRL
ncbi:MAG TPA: hypothetical protein VFU40_00665 [Gemmatimonadales bacterium]|nr:hypothetical protein [Gemmatimonadales bacterium]